MCHSVALAVSQTDRARGHVPLLFMAGFAAYSVLLCVNANDIKSDCAGVKRE